MAEELTDEQKAAAAKAAEDADAAELSADGEAGGDKDAEMTRLRVALGKANKEAGDRRKRLQELETAEQERQQSEMSETDRLKAELEATRKEAATANERAKDTLIRAAIAVEAAKAGATHPEDVYLLADKSTMEVDKDGNVKGATEAVEALVKAGRILISEQQRLAPGLDGGAGNGDRSKGGAKLTPEELEMARKMGVSPERASVQKAALLKETAIR